MHYLRQPGWQDLYDRADELYEQKNFVQGLVVAQKALELLEKERNPDQQSMSATLSLLGLLHREVGKFAEAESLYRRSLDISYNFV